MWPGLLLLLAAPLAAQDSARYQVSWIAPPSDATHPAATLYHWQLVVGDTTPKQTLAGRKTVGYTYGFANVYGGRYGYPTTPQATMTVARPTLDSLGPFRLAVQPAYVLPDTTMVLGPYSITAAWWTKPRAAVAPADPSIVPTGVAPSAALPNPILNLALQELPWP